MEWIPNHEIRALADRFGHAPDVLHCFNVRRRGVFVEGEDRTPRYHIPGVQHGKYRMFKCVTERQLYISTPMRERIDTPYRYEQGVIAYLGEPVLKVNRVGSQAYGGRSKYRHWYFHHRYWSESRRLPGTEVTPLIDMNHLGLSLADLCYADCGHCWRMYAEVRRYCKWKGGDLSAHYRSVESILDEIESYHGPSVFEEVRRVTISEGDPLPAAGPDDGTGAYREHLLNIRDALSARGFRGTITLATSRLDTDLVDFLLGEGFGREEVCLPLESFTRRNEYIKLPQKAKPFGLLLPTLRYAARMFERATVYILIGLKDGLDDLSYHLPDLKATGVTAQFALYKVCSPRHHDHESDDLKKMPYLEFVLKALQIIEDNGIPVYSESTYHAGILPAHVAVNRQDVVLD